MRKQMQVYSPVKNIVQDIKKELDLRNESEVIVYLAAIRTIFKDRITLNQHQEAIKIVEDTLNQQTM